MEKSSFFNAILDQEGTPDRSYLAEDFALYFNSFIGNGVFPNPSINLQLVSNNDMTVTLKHGSAWINGYFYVNTDDLIFNIDIADGVLNRIDRVVLRLDFLNREIKSYVKKGQFASAAIATDLQRDADAYEIALANIAISKGIISISQANITDLRLNKELCGIVHAVVDQVDTTAIFNQFQSWYSQTKTNYDNDIAKWTTEKKQAFDTWYNENTQAFMEQFTTWYVDNTNKWANDFNNWFNNIKGILDGDIAAKLALEINDLKKRADNVENNITKISTDVVKNEKSIKGLVSQTSENAKQITEHAMKKATLTTLGHIKAETDEEGKLILDIPKSNYNATELPTKNDDETKGYSVGSEWFLIKTVAGKKTTFIYFCINSETGNAYWERYVGSEEGQLYYTNGIEHIGFSEGIMEQITSGGNTVAIRKEDDYLYLEINGVGYTATAIGFSSDEMIRVTDIKCLYFEVQVISDVDYSTISVGLDDKRTGQFDFIAKTRIDIHDTDKTIINVDVSTLNGYYYIKTKLHTPDAGTSQIKITRIWGE